MTSELQSNYSAYSQSDDEDHTEFEAIKLIQEQVQEIQSLKAQLNQFNQNKQTMQIQATQIQSQNSQISNLKAQIKIFEERFSSMEEYQESNSHNISVDYERQVQVLKGQLSIAETYLKQETKKHHDLNDQNVCLKQELEIRDKMTQQVKMQVLQVQDELKQVTSTMQHKNQELAQSLTKTKNAKKTLNGEVKLLQEQNQKSLQIINEKNGEITSLVQKINEKEIQVRKSKLEVDKAKQGREYVESRVPQMEQQVVELNLVTEKMTREAEKEVKRRQEAVKDRDALQAKYLKLQEVIISLEIDDPEQFKQEFDILKKDIAKLRKQLSEKAKVVSAKEAKLKQKEDDLKYDADIIVVSLEKLSVWVNDQFKYDCIQKDVPLEWVLDPICEQLYQQLKGSQKGLSQKIQKVRNKQADHEHEIMEHKKLQGEIMNDFKRLQTQISTQKQEQAMQDIDISDARAFVKMLQREKEDFQIEMQAQRKFLVECYNQCMNIRHKFLQNTLISSQVELNVKQDFNQNQQISILELVNMIGNITNSLNFEIKNADLKNSQIKELEQMVENEKLRFDLKLAQLNQENDKALKKKQSDFDESCHGAEKVIQSQQQQQQEMNQEMQVLQVQMKQLHKEFTSKQENLQKSKDEVRNIRKCLPQVIIKMNELFSQKQALVQMLDVQVKAFAQIKLKINSLDKSAPPCEANFRHLRSTFKFRRCVISIIALNRMSKFKSVTIDQEILSKAMAKLSLPKNTASVVADHLYKQKDSQKQKHGRFDSVISMLGLGLNNLVQQVPRSQRLTDDLQKIVNPNKISFNPVQEMLNSTNNIIQDLETENESLKYARQEVETKHVNLQNQHKDLLINFTHFQQNQEQLRQELQESVPRNEYDRLKEAFQGISDEVASMRKQIGSATQQLHQQMTKMDELEQQKRQLFEQVLLTEQNVGDKERDLELRNIKIESLENIIKKRGIQEIQPAAESKTLKELQKSLAILEEKLLKAVKSKERLEQKLERVEQHHNAKMQDQSLKQAEIQKLFETNIQTLESRCQLFEMQNKQFKNDRDEMVKQRTHVPNNSLQLIQVTSPTFHGLEPSHQNRKMDEHQQQRYQLTNEKQKQGQSYEAQYIFSTRNWQSSDNNNDFDNNANMANHSFQHIMDNKQMVSDRQSSELSGGFDTMVFGNRALRDCTPSIASSQQALHGLMEPSVPGKISRSSSFKKV